MFNLISLNDNEEKEDKDVKDIIKEDLKEHKQEDNHLLNIKQIQKKLRQCQELQTKKENNILLDQDQLNKLNKFEHYKNQLDDMIKKINDK